MLVFTTIIVISLVAGVFAAQRTSLKRAVILLTASLLLVLGATGSMIWQTYAYPATADAQSRLIAQAAQWSSGPAAPIALGEVAAGIIGNKLYLIGEGNAATLNYDLASRQWSSLSALAQRPFVGNHHAAEVVGGKLYVFGGLDNGSDGKVQIFDPSTNNGRGSWTVGAAMPFAAGSSASAVINGEVYVAGGIVGSSTTNQVAKYHPQTNTWTALAPMPQARNHAAAATDGSKLYVFGGRGPGSGDGNVVANGFNTVQVYDPATNRWQSSASGASLAPLPQARGGMGKAVYANGEFYVIGGETKDGAGAVSGNVYNRVDIYNPQTNTWRLGPTLPTARHGIFPLLANNRIYVAAGGIKAGNSQSNVLEILDLIGAQPSPSASPSTSPAPSPARPLPIKRWLPYVGK